MCDIPYIEKYGCEKVKRTIQCCKTLEQFEISDNYRKLFNYRVFNRNGYNIGYLDCSNYKVLMNLMVFEYKGDKKFQEIMKAVNDIGKIKKRKREELEEKFGILKE